MRFGFCAPAEQTAVISAAGYDFIEWALAPTLRAEQPAVEVMPTLQDALTGLPIRPEAFNVFLPGGLKVVGEDADKGRQDRYVQAAFERVAALGGKLVVFGSGASRGVPEGFSRSEAKRQVIDFLRRCGPVAANHGLTVVIEPLNTGECNFINSVAEAVEVAQAVDHAAVAVLSDLYHVAVERQPYDETRAAGTRLRHVHVAGAEGRRAPNALDVDYLTPYFRVLKEMDYQGRVSVEGGFRDLAREASETLETLHRAWRLA